MNYINHLSRELKLVIDTKLDYNNEVTDYIQYIDSEHDLAGMRGLDKFWATNQKRWPQLEKLVRKIITILENYIFYLN